MSKCPECGKKLRARQKVMERGTAEEKYRSRFVRYEPAENSYAPFCSLRCGFKYGVYAHALFVKKSETPAPNDGKRRARRNAWGNWNGYIGRNKVLEFGTDELRAGHWVATGSNEPNAAYQSKETIASARAALPA